MPTLPDRKLEKVAQELAQLRTAEQASKAAGYDDTRSSFKSNARKRACRADVKARVQEIQGKDADEVSFNIAAWIEGRLIEIASPKLAESKIKVSDQISALQSLGKIHDIFAPEKVKADVNIWHDFSPEDQRALADFIEALSRRSSETGDETEGDS